MPLRSPKELCFPDEKGDLLWPRVGGIITYCQGREQAIRHHQSRKRRPGDPHVSRVLFSAAVDAQLFVCGTKSRDVHHQRRWTEPFRPLTAWTMDNLSARAVRPSRSQGVPLDPSESYSNPRAESHSNVPISKVNRVYFLVTTKIRVWGGSDDSSTKNCALQAGPSHQEKFQ
jgi:hypothetical protein